MDENNNISNESKGTPMLKIVIIVVVLIAVLFGAWYMLNRESTSSDVDTIIGENVAAVVAVVNGEEISRDDFSRLLIAQNVDIGPPQDEEQKALQNQMLDILISQTVLLQKAKQSGIVIDDEEVNLRLSQTREQFPDEQAFATALSEQGFTQESFRDFTKNDMLIQNYVSSQVDLESITVSDEEIKAEYDLAATKQDNLPGLETLSGPIKNQLTQQKQQQLVSEFITKLKNESDIKILLE